MSVMPHLESSSWQSVEQIGNRADRMRIGTDELFLYASTDIEVNPFNYYECQFRFNYYECQFRLA